MNYPIRYLSKDLWPQSLLELPKSQVPKRLRIRGVDFNPNHKRVCIIGSRKFSDYGRVVCQKIVEGLSGYPVTIVSGLAYGIDSLAHRLALENSLGVIAIPGSGLTDQVIYPKRHFGLAQEILKSNGCLISEYDDNQPAQNWTFPQRNRLMAGISDLVLIIEATEKSGTMITARLALDYNINLACIPGSILDENSQGTNKLLKEGAYVITEAEDVLNLLGIEKDSTLVSRKNEEKIKSILSEMEFKIFKLLENPISKEKLLEQSGLEIYELNAILSKLEIEGLVEFIGDKICRK